MPRPRVYTIGHSNRTVEDLVAALRANRVQCLLDVRTVPRSRAQPQFNRDTLPDALAPHGIGYEHVPALGGLRHRDRNVDASINGAWENESFHAYADYALTEPFRTALNALIDRARHQRCAVICAEAVWWRCHRRIIADHLIASGIEVVHIMSPTRHEPAQLSAHARVSERGEVTYPSLV